jgi:hypothetical protein
VHTLDSQHVYDMNGDAVDGRVWTRIDWVAADSYRVYDRPVESPIHTVPAPPADARTLALNPANLTASPFGWLSEPRAAVLLVLVGVVAIGGGRRWLQAVRARRAVDRLADPDVTPEEIRALGEHGREGLIELFRLLETAPDAPRREAAGAALSRLWERDQLVAEEEKAIVTRAPSSLSPRMRLGMGRNPSPVFDRNTLVCHSMPSNDACTGVRAHARVIGGASFFGTVT